MRPRPGAPTPLLPPLNPLLPPSAQRRWLAASTPAELVTAVSQSGSRAPSRAVSPNPSSGNGAGLALGSFDGHAARRGSFGASALGGGGRGSHDDDGGIDVEGSADRRASFVQQLESAPPGQMEGIGRVWALTKSESSAADEGSAGGAGAGAGARPRRRRGSR